jgi:hypothetical protein
MPNHVHLMLQTPEPNLGRGMQWLHSRYALAFNERHGRIGHLFESPYKSPLVRTDAAFIRTIGYVVVNPVKAALCKAAVDWPWGSHAIVMDQFAAPAPWIAHNDLVERLNAITGASCYVELCATSERDALNFERSRSQFDESEPLDGSHDLLARYAAL